MCACLTVNVTAIILILVPTISVIGVAFVPVLKTASVIVPTIELVAVTFFLIHKTPLLLVAVTSVTFILVVPTTPVIVPQHVVDYLRQFLHPALRDRAILEQKPP